MPRPGTFGCGEKKRSSSEAMVWVRGRDAVRGPTPGPSAPCPGGLPGAYGRK